MDIVVCLKQVPDVPSIRIDQQRMTIIREGVESIINPLDYVALEAAWDLRNREGGQVIALTMGPPQSEAALREALALGADEAVLLSDRAFAGSDTWSTSYTLAAGIKKLGACDIVLCGKQAIDGDTAQVGPGVAQFLDMPQVTYVRKLDVEGAEAVAQRMMEDGYDVVRVPLPALFTVVKEINEPRLPSLKGKMRAKKADINVWTQADLDVDPAELGLDGSPTRVVRIFAPEPRGGGVVFEGEVDETVEKLTAELLPILRGDS